MNAVSAALPAAQSLLASYARAVLPRRRRPGAPTPERELLLPNVSADPDRVARYAAVCGFDAATARAVLPAPYPHLVAFPAALSLMTRRDFPFRVLGLVHVANRIEQLRPLAVAEPLTYRVTLGPPRPHPKGTAFDALAEATAGSTGEPVWRSTSTYLSRHPRPDAPPSPPAPDLDDPPGTDHAPWPVPAATGRRYAAVSGDRNPIHLHPLTARPFGFRRPIAHGMWAKARCLAALPPLPDAFTAHVTFHAPIPLPTHVTLRTNGPTFTLHPP
ncbi:MaoC/PaaZ C-terminal domain-containing protein, partial [Streptomyces sp. B6B3]|uniref:MaoC family dehydratase n=1 Tax=Streptomyces sp. B6B3 TaxID=3153570 RepID=UPI00325F72DF